MIALSSLLPIQSEVAARCGRAPDEGEKKVTLKGKAVDSLLWVVQDLYQHQP